jgi:hypothetical protein
MNNDRYQYSNYHQELSSRSAICFDFPLYSNKKFSISDSINITLNAKIEKPDDANSKIKDSQTQNNNKDKSKVTKMRNKVNIKQ